MIDKIQSYVKKNCDSYEIYLEESNREGFEICDTKIDFVSQGSTDGLGVRVNIGNKIGFASTNNVPNFRKCVDNAIKIAKLNKKDPDFVKFACPGKYPNVKSYDKKLTNLNIEDMHEFSSDIVSSVKKAKVKIIRGRYGRSLSNVKVINSEGVDVDCDFSSNSVYYQLLKGKVSDSFEDSGRSILKPELDKHIAKLEMLKNKKHIPTVDVPTLFGPEALAEMIDTLFAKNLSAYNVQKKQSSFGDKLGKEVFSPKFSLIDDGTKGSSCTKCDDEGTPSSKKVLVGKGVLKSFLYDSYSANVEKVKSTGNGFRNYSNSPSIEMSNVYVDKGSKTFDKMISSIDKGIYVDSLMGYHTANSLTGDFSLSVVNGFYVEKGAIKFALKDSMLAGNFFEMLKDIDSVENKQSHYYSYYMPHIMFKNAKLVGN